MMDKKETKLKSLPYVMAYENKYTLKRFFKHERNWIMKISGGKEFQREGITSPHWCGLDSQNNFL